MVAGRGFTEQDMLGKPWRVVISKRLAELLWPGQSPDRPHRHAVARAKASCKGEVVGVVSDMRERGLEGGPTLAVYIPAYGALGGTTLQLVMHTKRRTGVGRARAALDCHERRSDAAGLRDPHAGGSRHRVGRHPPVDDDAAGHVCRPGRCCWRLPASTACSPIRSPGGPRRSACGSRWAPDAAACCAG